VEINFAAGAIETQDPARYDRRLKSSGPSNKRTVVERDIVDGLMYILSTRCRWAAPQRGLPVRTLDRLNHAL
jgi:hypothetical protein